MSYLPKLPRASVRETDRGYTEYVFDKPLPLSDPLIGYALEEFLETEPDMIDVRDDVTVWVHD